MSNLADILGKIPTYSEELGLDLTKEEDRFLWFLASILFAKRISARIAINTFKVFIKRGLTTPQRFIEAGWDVLVDVLDEGGYVRYDFSTASNLLEIMSKLVNEYGGKVDNIHGKALDYKDLERRLLEFKGVGPVAINIFLRELRGIWIKAKPKISDKALTVARRIGLKENIEHYESRLVRIYIEYCKRGRCIVCPIAKYCEMS